MSLETLLAENTASTTALAAALVVNSGFLERVVDNQKVILAQYESDKAARAGGPATRTRRSSAKTDAPAADDAAPQPETPAAEAPKTVVEVTEADVKSIAVPYLGGTEPYTYGTDETKATRGQFLKAIADHFGSPTLVGEKATLGADERKQTVFFLKRKIAGAEVNFSQDYDFDGDPAQGAAADEADEFDIG